jgi:hypothetical protein
MKSALPFITYFLRKPKVDEEKQTLKKHDSLVNTEKVIDFASKLAEFGVVHDTDSESDDFELEEGEDPLGRLGAGIISYFTLIRLIFFVLVCASISSIPTLIRYRAGEHNVLQAIYNTFSFKNSIAHLGIR